jgi:cell division protein YceG involved in septum cleavage
VSEDPRQPVRQGEGSVVGRTEMRRQRVRRRRILGAIGGAVLVVVLAFVFWYELQSHALGPAGRRVVVQVKSGESLSTVVGQLSADHVIGSGLAFRISDLWHGSPTVVPGEYALHENLTFAQVRAILNSGPNI